MKKKAVAIPFEILFLLLNIYSAVYCLFYSIKPLHDFIFTHAHSIYKLFLDGSESTIFFYGWAMIIGAAAFVVLLIIYSVWLKKGCMDTCDFVPFVCAVIPFFGHFLNTGVSPQVIFAELDMWAQYGYLKYIYLAMAIMFIANIFFSVKRLIKLFR